MTTRRAVVASPTQTHPGPASAEPKPLAPPPGVFVSPRVVDEDAFAQFAGALRDAAAAAQGEREALKAEMVEVKRLAGSLDADWGPGGARMKRLAAITQALQGVEARLAKVDDAVRRLDDAGKALERAEEVERRLEAVVRRAEEALDARQRGLEAFLDERLAAFSRGLHERVVGADARLEQHAKETERKLIERAAHVENVADQRAEALRMRLAAQLDEAARAARDLADVDASRSVKDLTAAIERGETLSKLLDERSRAIETSTRGAEDRLALAAETSMKRLGEHLEARGDALRARAEDAERRADAAAREATEVLTEAERRAEHMRMQVEAVLTPRLQALEETLAQAKAMCRAPEPGQDSETLAGFVERGEKVRAGVAQGLRALGALKEQIDEAARTASRTILDAADQIDALERRREDLMRSLKEALDLCEIAGSKLRSPAKKPRGGAPGKATENDAGA